jgi:predicted XRE-type DNA-binding protein
MQRFCEGINEKYKELKLKQQEVQERLQISRLEKESELWKKKVDKVTTLEMLFIKLLKL